MYRTNGVGVSLSVKNPYFLLTFSQSLYGWRISTSGFLWKVSASFLIASNFSTPRVVLFCSTTIEILVPATPYIPSYLALVLFFVSDPHFSHRSRNIFRRVLKDGALKIYKAYDVTCKSPRAFQTKQKKKNNTETSSSLSLSLCRGMIRESAFHRFVHSFVRSKSLSPRSFFARRVFTLRARLTRK